MFPTRKWRYMRYYLISNLRLLLSGIVMGSFRQPRQRLHIQIFFFLFIRFLLHWKNIIFSQISSTSWGPMRPPRTRRRGRRRGRSPSTEAPRGRAAFRRRWRRRREWGGRRRRLQFPRLHEPARDGEVLRQSDGPDLEGVRVRQRIRWDSVTHVVVFIYESSSLIFFPF